MRDSDYIFSGDEAIERCAPSGSRAVSAVKDAVPMMKTLEEQFPRFAWRVRMAISQLKQGATRQEVREQHGSVVLQAAEQQIALAEGAQ